MSEVRTAPVKAKRIEDIDAEPDLPGAFEYYQAGDQYPAGLIYICPCGCKRTGALAFRNQGGERPSWEWDGNLEAPTLSPSVHHVGHWHGWLQAGVWTSC